MMSNPCAAPTTVPSIIPNATLLSIFLLIRHGARAPLWGSIPSQIGVWRCNHAVVTPPHRIPTIHGRPLSLRPPSKRPDFPPDCGYEDLLDEGFNQLVNLGTAYRKYLISETQHLPFKFNFSQTSVFSTNTPRTIYSAMGFMKGLYPVENDGEHLPLNLINIWSADDDRILPQDKLFQKRVEESKKILKPILDFYNLNYIQPMELMKLSDYFTSCKCSTNPYNEIVTDKLYERMMDDYQFIMALGRQKNGINEFNWLWQFIDGKIEEFFEKKSNAKFTLISGHDTNWMSILAGLGNAEFLGKPPFASHVAIELWELGETFVRFVANGRVVKVDGKELTSLAEFRKRVKSGNAEL